ncbi:helix-turn-helix domain-containing protein [Chryseobacterium sp. H1D6B]|uniref:helix-turn-helix domain-containing protein n=1 Tax=Chryseobacterium sp. H1D6B TaxID=2940588 RepID=UPI0015CCEFB3|nr:helix-turn-helix domain-containing protein [Chryseobacterium sp. H1D6B]
MRELKSQIPNYKRIFEDIIKMKYPGKKEKCSNILYKKELLALDIIKLNQIIFGIQDKESFMFNQSHRSYSTKTIFEILDYQKKNKLNNSETAAHFKMSRNTIAKWKKLSENNLLIHK